MVAPHHSGLEWQIDSLPIEDRKRIIERLKLGFRLDIRYGHHDTGDFLKGVSQLQGFTPQLVDVVMNDTIADVRRRENGPSRQGRNSADRQEYKIEKHHGRQAPYFRAQSSEVYAAHL
ncbi:hypothetical protein HYU19_04205 [Candidatus Woesearchaeota archaeon]|nr:hypothetical protein [Candidatus Woesearchaeota archaeon]